jgi:hypothetical protein
MCTDGKAIKPPLAFRLGVTGAVDLSPDAVTALRETVAAILDAVHEECERLAKETWAAKVYATDANGVQVQLKVLSPLAEGADRLAAGEALDHGYALSVALPFHQKVYEKDFPDSIDAFCDMLSRAEGRVLALDGCRGADEWRSYEAVGRLIVRNCDLLIAIWDETVPPKGRGGTADTIRYAVHVGLPVWWIHASGQKPSVLIENSGGLRKADPAKAHERLMQYMRERLRPPPPPPHPKAHGILHGLIDACRRLSLVGGSKGDNPLFEFLNDVEPKPRAVWEAYGFFMRMFGFGVSPHNSESSASISDYWTKAYDPPDRLSKAYAMRYRSTYVYVFALAAVALICAALALAFEALSKEAWGASIAACELLALGLIFVLAFWSNAGSWHERWIGCRLLAELFRKQQALAMLGWSLPALDVTRAASPGAVKTTWIDWYFEAIVRASSLVAGQFGKDQLDKDCDMIRSTLLAGQIDYHKHRAALSDAAARRLLFGGETCFFLTLVFVISKILTLLLVGPSEGVIILGLMAAVLPALSAAFFALRAYAELEVLTDQSKRMIQLLEALQQRLEDPDLTRPLASQELGTDLFRLATAMLADVAGWAQLFRMKAVETG